MVDPSQHNDEQDPRREWAERRSRYIGATDSPKLLGLSRYGTPLTVYHDKLDPHVDEPSLPAWLGLKLERAVGELYTMAMGIPIRADKRDHYHKEHPFIGCHLDFRVRGQPSRLVECKTRAYMHGWGEDGSSTIPVETWVQVQHEMLVTGATQCDVAVLFGHHTFNVYPIKRDEEFLNELVPQLITFWEEHVVKRVPPEPIGHWLDDQQIRRDHPHSDGTMKAATPEQVAIARQLRATRMNAAQVAVAQDELENRLKVVIGDADGLTLPFGTITFKQSKDSTRVDWEQVAITYKNVIEEVFTLANPGDDEQAVSRLARAQSVFEVAESLATSTTPGSRRFVVSFKEEQE